MKYLKITLATIIFVMSFAMQSNEVKAQGDCEFGYSSSTIIRQYPNSSCWYRIEFCYQCTQFGTAPGNTIIITNYESTDPTNNDCQTDDIVNWVNQMAANEWYDLCTIPPCEQNTVTYTVEMPLCIKTVNYSWENPNGTIDNRTWVESCIDSEYKCVSTFTVCYDATSDTYVYDLTGRQTQGILDCSEYEPSYPPGNLTWEDDWETECFLSTQRENDCNLEIIVLP